MLFWRCLICVMLAGGVACGLARSDSWQLMVEAGLDGPDRRITPKSVFIAPVYSRQERCRPGFRYDHLGRCVKVVRIDANAQVHLFLKHLQGSQGGLKTTAPFVPSAASSSSFSNGPLQFSLPIAKVEISPTELPPKTTILPPTTTFAPTTTTTAPTTTTTSTESTTVTTADEYLSTQSQEVTTISTLDQTYPTLTAIADGSGSGDQSTIAYDGSGEEATEEGSGAEIMTIDEGSGLGPTAIPAEERDTRSTTTTSSEETETTEIPTSYASSPDTNVTEMTPVPPNNATASLIYAILRGIEAWKLSESSTPAPMPINADTSNTILIPLETIQLSPQVPFTTTERTNVETSDSEEDSVIKTDSKENNVPFYSGTSWVRFPDETSLEITARDESEEITPKFRFPEEKVDPEQRPAILRFWSTIPMYKEEEAPKSDEQWAAP